MVSWKIHKRALPTKEMILIEVEKWMDIWDTIYIHFDEDFNIINDIAQMEIEGILRHRESGWK
ncbi:MAG: hypothetical protein ACOC5T_08605 [Elusimicrobiota bacterium]